MKMKEKNKTKIIIAIIAAFGLIIPSCIDLEQNQENNSPKNIETDSSDEYHSETTDIKKYHYNTSEDVVEDESNDNSDSNNSENTSGNVFQDVYVEGDLTVKQEVPHEEKKNYEENENYSIVSVQCITAGQLWHHEQQSKRWNNRWWLRRSGRCHYRRTDR